MTNDFGFTFSDMIAGYVKHYDWDGQTFSMETSDGRNFDVKLSANIFAELVRNLDEAFIDCTGLIKNMLGEDRFLYVYGIFYPDGGAVSFEAKHLLFLGKEENEYRFEKQDWWIRQVKKLGDYYLKAQFGDGEINFANYRTSLTLEGEQTGNIRQETDTISRLVYGFASAYLMTGNDRYLEAAEKGTEYLREHMRCVDSTEDTAFWYHGIDLVGKRERKIFASEFGDDYDAIPAYEQIYALAGPTQTYRITGDPAILNDIRMTCNLFDKYYLDRKLGGYFSHIDPIMFDPRAESLDKNRSRKNWNSVGDHAPAFLINIYIATEDERYRKMLMTTADTIAEHFPDYENSPFVQEKFHEDWSHDQTWGWQQNRGVVGHNLKIAWNLTRINNLEQKKEYTDFAGKIATLMPKHGGDAQRGGWYDVVDRTLKDGEKFHRCAWHDRKAWWQQEQGILAYLIMAGTTGKPEYLRLARESASFYNAWFLDHDSGGVYFNVLANGQPYLMGTERLKGSHSMSGYHSFELAYLAAVYSNLLITKQHMDFYFKPNPHSLKDNILRVAPDLLPRGSIKVDKVWINGEEHGDFDADNLTVTIPVADKALKVKVRIAPIGSVEHFTAGLETDGDVHRVIMKGQLDHAALPSFKKVLDQLVDDGPSKVVFVMDELETMSNRGVRSIIFEKQRMDLKTNVYVVGANENIKKLFDQDELTEEVNMLDSYDKSKIV